MCRDQRLAAGGRLQHQHFMPAMPARQLAQAIIQALDHPDATAEIARQLRVQVQAAFSVDTMVDGVLSAYQTAIETVRKTGRR